MDDNSNNANAHDWLGKGMTTKAYDHSMPIALSSALSETAMRVLRGEPGDNAIDREIRDVKRDICALLSGFCSGESLQRSALLRTLAEKAVQYAQRHTDDDIEQWASRLADDASDHTD